MNSSMVSIGQQGYALQHSVLSLSALTADQSGIYCCEVGGERSCIPVTILEQQGKVIQHHVVGSLQSDAMNVVSYVIMNHASHKVM